MLERRRRPTAFGIALTIVALSTRSFPAASAFNGRPAGPACSRGSVRGGAGTVARKPPCRHSNRRRLVARDDATTLGWRGRHTSLGCRGPRGLCGSLRWQQAEGQGGAEEGIEAGEEAQKSVAEMIEGIRQGGAAAASEIGGQSEGVDGSGRSGEDALLRKDDKERRKAERGRRIWNTLDLLDTLMKFEVNLLEILEEFSSTFRDEDGVIQEERLVGEIARPVVARVRRLKARDAKRRIEVAQSRGEQLGPSFGAKAFKEQAKPFPKTAAEIDEFLRSTKVTAWDAVRAYKVLTPGERIRRQKISLRHRDPVRWRADKMAEEAEKRRRKSDPAYLAEKREERRLRAIRRYETRRRNGNSGKGKPRSKADQKKAEELAAARAAAIAAGLATEADFAPPRKRIPKKDIPTVKRRRGRPRRVLTTEEQAAKALGPRPVGRPRKLPVEPPPPAAREPATECHVTASLASIVSAWMAGAAEQAARAAGGPRSLAALADLESRVKALAVSKTKEVTGSGPGDVWTPTMTRIALAGIEAWDNKWKEVLSRAGDGDGDGDGGDGEADAEADAAGGGLGSGSEDGEKRGRDDAPRVLSTPKAPRHDLPTREGVEEEEGGVVVAKAEAEAAPTAAAAMHPGLLAGKAVAVAEGGGGELGDAAPFSCAPPPSAGAASGNGEKLASPPAVEVARELAVDAPASKFSR